MPFEPWQLLIGAVGALLVGVSKTGLPGVGILAVPLMVAVFGGRLSIGALLPLLIFADCFAVAFYRVHARWDHLRRLAPWVLVGLLSGTVLLGVLGKRTQQADPLGPLIGLLVLGMLALTLLRHRLGDRLVPTSRPAAAVAGVLAGFTTLVSNAAGPIMAIYMSAVGSGKQALLGTTAWYFFLLNLAKVPLLLLVTAMSPAEPIFTRTTLLFDLLMLPLVLVGVLAGKWLVNRVSEQQFQWAVLALAALAALKLLLAS